MGYILNLSLPTLKGYPAIEGLRGTLALIVCCGHFGFGTVLNKMGMAFNLHFAVDLFFIISGLVLAYSNYYCLHPVLASHFIIKRIARLYPLHLLTLVLICGLNVVNNLPNPPWDVIKNLFLIHNIGLGVPSHGLNFPSWSVSVEFWSSILLFFVTLICKNRWLFSVLAIGYLFAFCIWCSTPCIVGDYEAAVAGIFNIGLLRGIAGILIGILIYFALSSPIYRKICCLTVVKYGSLVGLVLFLLLELPPFTNIIAFYLFSAGFIGALCASRFLGVLKHPCLVWLGAISYSIYLLHIPLYHLLQTYIGNGAVKGIAGKLILLPLLFLLATCSFFFFEQPMQQKLKQRFLKRHSDPIGLEFARHS